MIVTDEVLYKLLAVEPFDDGSNMVLFEVRLWARVRW
jgi:hypothetical protein